MDHHALTLYWVCQQEGSFFPADQKGEGNWGDSVAEEYIIAVMSEGAWSRFPASVP